MVVDLPRILDERGNGSSYVPPKVWSSKNRRAMVFSPVLSSVQRYIDLFSDGKIEKT